MRNLAELEMNAGPRPLAAGRLVIREPPTNDEIEAFESEYQVKLPDEYLAFLRFANGGHPNRGWFKPLGLSKYWNINVFYHLDSDKGDLTGLWRQSMVWRDFAAHTLIPIGDDPCGDQIVLSFDSTAPNVKLIVHDGESVLQIAASFAEFIDMLELPVNE